MVIAALLLINVFFLAVIFIDTVDKTRSERQAIENVCAVLRAGGIMIDPDDVNGGGAIRTMRTTREDETEALIARAVLGETEMTDQGVILFYESAGRGRAEFASAGDFEIELYEGVITASAGTVRTVQRILREMKLETSELNLSGEQGSEIVTAVSAYRGASIFNCTIDFVFDGDSLVTIKGRYVTRVEAAEDGAEISTVGTALLVFLAAVKSEDRQEIDCTRIYEIRAGYMHRVVGSYGESVIDPAWLIMTDAGRYVIVDATGEIRLFS